MLRHRERMEENGIAPLTWEGKRSAAAAPDAEVVDKPTRRRFSPSYKLRVVEEADRCTEPGEVGRLLRREGLYSSHLTTWRKAVRSGWLRALSKRRGRKPSERNPAGGESAQAGAREHSPGEGTREGAPDHRRPGKSCRAAGIEPRGRDELVKAAEALATYVGVKPACDALRVARATFYRRRRPSTGHQEPQLRKCDNVIDHIFRCPARYHLDEVPPVAVPLPMLDPEPSVVPGVGAS